MKVQRGNLSRVWKVLGLLLFLGMSGAGNPAQAGVFAMPHFVEPEHFSLGVEPEVVLSNGSGVGINGKVTYGISDLMNVLGVVGTGGGPRSFRIGGASVFDFFPDADGQPGVGLAAQGLYYRRREVGRFEVTAVPYVHKAFKMQEGSEIDPFVAVPFGWGFRSDEVDFLMQLAVGSSFKTSEHFSTVIEIGIDINRSDTYVSGGIVYYY